MEKYCHKSQLNIKIIRQSNDINSTLLICEHTIDDGSFQCDEPCVYSLGAQMGGLVGIKMINGQLNPDGTIPIDILLQCGAIDCTN
jgi:hypothetical protein